MIGNSVRSMTSMYFASPCNRKSRWFQKSWPTAAQVSLYAVMFGSSYGLPNASPPPVEPMPPVM